MKPYISAILALLMLFSGTPVYAAANLLPNPNPQFFNNSGAPCSGCKLYFYESGTSTAKDTYISSAMTTTNANPVVLNSRGEAATGIWLDGSTSAYSVTLKTSAGSTIWGPKNDIRGVGDLSALTEAALRWIASDLAPSYSSATQFTVSGDQTAIFVVGRRLQIAVTAGTVYGRITASSYATSVTTVTVALDSGALDSGISTVKYSLESPINTSLSPDMLATNGTITTGLPVYLSGNVISTGTNTFSGLNTFTTGTILFNSAGTNKIQLADNSFLISRAGSGSTNGPILTYGLLSSQIGTVLSTIMSTPTFTSGADSANTYVVGPAGSTKALPCMDTIPDTSRIAAIGVIVQSAATAGNRADVFIVAPDSNAVVGVASAQSGGSQNAYDTNMFFVPLDSNRRFKVYWNFSGGGQAKLYCMGYSL